MPIIYGQKPTDGSLPSVHSPVAVKADNLIRRFLRVSNPNDPKEIADGLLRLYPGAAQQQQLEEAGLPFYQVQTVEVRGRQDGAPAAVELVQARNDTSRDLDSLLQKAVLKDIQPELRGWQSAVEGIIADASQTARFALDPRQRDRTYASRRLLGDYARIARFVGAMTPYLNADYRNLAKSLDEVASVLLVTMGDAIANIGSGGGRFLLQAPASELQERREAVLAALRNLNGSVQSSYDQSTWPWGLDGLRRVLSQLDANGHSDLRAFFEENTVARIMDDLIARASTPGVDGLRALGSTAALSLQQLRRLVFVTQAIDAASPPLITYLDALLLFIEGFAQGASGSRLLYIARPPIVFYGLYGIGGPDQATRALIDLVILRGALADLIDCILECSCSQENIRWQILLDKVLYDLDRAIDYFSLGSDPDFVSGQIVASPGQGEPENRARTFGLIIEYLLNRAGSPLPEPRGPSELRDTLSKIRDVLIGQRPPGVFLLPGNIPEAVKKTMLQELRIQDDGERQWENLLQTMAPSCHSASTLLGDITTVLQHTIDQYLHSLDTGYVAPDVTVPATIPGILTDINSKIRPLNFARSTSSASPTLSPGARRPRRT
jgi:hypothetical protein